MDYLIVPHFGLGDQLIMNGYIHDLIETENPKSITIIADGGYQRKTLEHLYSDIPCVKFFWMNNLHKGPRNEFIVSLAGYPMKTPILLDGHPYSLMGFGHYSHNRNAELPGHSWADTFYLQGNADPVFRFTKFKLPKNMTGSEDLYLRVISKVGSKYILLADEPRINRKFNENFVLNLLQQSGNEKLPVIYLGIDRYKYPLLNGLNNVDLSEELKCDSLLDLWKLIENATECHFMDSSISCMTDLMKNPESKLHIHAYMTDCVNAKNPIYTNRKWSLWFENDLQKP